MKIFLLLIGFFIGYVICGLVSDWRLRVERRRWLQHIDLLNGMYDDERSFFYQAIELAAKYRTNMNNLRGLFLGRLSEEERKEIERLMEVDELEALYKDEQRRGEVR